MQSYTPRPPSQQTWHNPASSFHTAAGTHAPRGAYADPVARAMMHNFEPSSHGAMPSGYGHFSPSSPMAAHPPVYGHRAPAPFKVPTALPVHTSTPYQQMYHYAPAKPARDFHFPFRTLMILLVAGAVSLSVYAAYRAFANPSPVNAGFLAG